MAQAPVACSSRGCPPAGRAQVLKGSAPHPSSSGAKGQGRGTHQLWLSGCCWALGSQGPGHLLPHPLIHSLPLPLPLWGPIFPYMVKEVPRRGGEDKGRSPAAGLPQLPKISQVVAASPGQVKQLGGDPWGPQVVGGNRVLASLWQPGLSGARWCRFGDEVRHSEILEEEAAASMLSWAFNEGTSLAFPPVTHPHFILGGTCADCLGLR